MRHAPSVFYSCTSYVNLNHRSKDMKTILPSVEVLAETLTWKQIEIEALLDEVRALRVGIAEKTTEIKAMQEKLSAVIENINTSVQTYNTNLTQHGVELNLKISEVLSSIARNHQEPSGFNPYSSHVGSRTVPPFYNPYFTPARYPADVSFKTHDQTIPVAMGGMASPQERSTAALTSHVSKELLEEIAEFRRQYPNSDWFKNGGERK